MFKVHLALPACVLLASATVFAQAPAARPAPAPLESPAPHYVSFQLTEEVNASADAVWAKVGKYCDIAAWSGMPCRIVQGPGEEIGTVRSILNEVMVGKTTYSYTYTQAPRQGAVYNLYHGTLEVVPVTAKTSRLQYSFLYDNSMLADDAAREAEIATRKTRFGGYLKNMKAMAEGRKVEPPVAPPIPAATWLVAEPHYISIPMSIEVNAPADKVWARIGKYCDIGEWGIPGCSIVSGDGGLGTIRTIGSEILVGKTKTSYIYTQPKRVGANYNLYHGQLWAEPVTASTTRLNYTLMLDNSALPDDAARQKDIDNRRTRFTKMLENMKLLAEGKPLPEGAVVRPATPPANMGVPVPK
ncbi:SRPBCC family protein [Terriglobus tenax]|uniref:hypothetical protein n=1 Tax=Terriglobus tenax TaxID=1111115 RepID=UPI0021E065AA|nr:hypothetical protein [Terriglobus tenax]